MAIDQYVMRDGRRLRCGYTTGTCAAAAARGAAMILAGMDPGGVVDIDTPRGWRLSIPLAGRDAGEGWARCTVIKDAGDDPDVTNGLAVTACVALDDGTGVRFAAGPGVGTVTRRGLAVPPGEAAINPVPRRMIAGAVTAVLGGERGVLVTVSAPGGEELARRTFNGRLGITGGISILGTTGIVEPLSHDAVTESLELGIAQARAEGVCAVAMVPGSLGERWTLEVLGVPAPRILIAGNHVGFMLRRAAEQGIVAVLLSGHLGKLVKVAGGIFETHSAVADARMEVLGAHYTAWSGDVEALRRIMACVTTSEALEIAGDRAFLDSLADTVSRRAAEHAGGGMTVAAALFDDAGAVRGMSAGAASLVAELRGEIRHA